jgi:hypothetical protein
MVAPQWMHTPITAAEYDSWTEEQCAGIEIVDGMVIVSPRASKRHNRLARSWPMPWTPPQARTGTRTPTSTSGYRMYR